MSIYEYNSLHFANALFSCVEIMRYKKGNSYLNYDNIVF